MESPHITKAEVAALINSALGQRDDYWRTKVESLESRVRVLEQSAPGPAGPAGRSTVSSRRVSKTPGRVCFCCGGGTAVHRHRDLGIPLDDKCRKQVETIRQGGVLTERREAWGQTLRKILPNARALEMLVALEGQVDGQAPPTKRRRFSGTDDDTSSVDHPMSGGSCGHGDKCTICHEPADEQTQNIMELPCKHSFHKNCIVPWLQQNAACPNCRAPTVLESNNGQLRAVVGPPVLHQKSSCGTSCAPARSCSATDFSELMIAPAPVYPGQLQRSHSGRLLNGEMGDPIDGLTDEDLNVFLEEGSPSNKDLGGLSLSLDDSMAFLPLPEVAPEENDAAHTAASA